MLSAYLMMGYSSLKLQVVAIVCLITTFSTPNCVGFTNPLDLLAINSLYAALGFPPLAGWLLAGGDPCSEGWQGVQCVNSNITGIVLNDANLGGELGENLGVFGSIIQIDLSNNHIRGGIPSNLPLTIKTFFLSGNQLTGTIPDSLSTLGQLTDLSLNNNHLSGVIPDSFQQLTSLINLDLSSNNLSGHLPPSMANLSSISTLHLEDNRLTGVLDVLQDLPVIDLDVENNLFSGPIPPKLLSIPNFRSKGNPFNTTVIPSPPVSSPLPSPVFETQPPEINPRNEAFRPSPPEPPVSPDKRKSLTSNFMVWIAVGGFLILILFALGLCFRVSRHGKEKSTIKVDDHMKNTMVNAFDHKDNEASSNDKGRHHLSPRSNVKEEKTRTTFKSLSPSRPPQFVPGERVSVKPVDVTPAACGHTSQHVDSTRSFSIASLQQYTNSFSQENLIGRGVLGAVYRVELPNGKRLAVKKLENAASRQWSHERFMELVSTVSKLRNENIIGLEGYCVEHGHRLFVYEHCGNGTLHDALHLNDEIHEKLSWNARARLALQAAKALEYLHEVCQPLVVHRNFTSANILLDDELHARVSDCGLAPLIPPSYISQLQGSGYGAPELESGNYTYQSDVYSFGVVMLELLTGRKAYDRSRPRGEQFLVRWAIPRLHDIEMLSRMVDPSLDAICSSKSLSRFADIISLCVQAEPEFRPPMSEIVQNLLHMIEINH